MSAKAKESETAEPAKEHKPRKPRKQAAKDSKAEAKAAEEIAALNDRLLRLQADFENFRKRTLREKGEIYERANEELMLEMLPVIDHLELALSHLDSNGGDPAFAEGIKLVGEQLLAALGKFKLSVVDASGKEFDPNLHEAVSHLPCDDVPENHVMEQTRRGYLLGDRLLRAAQVVVSSGPLGTQGADSGRESGEDD